MAKTTLRMRMMAALAGVFVSPPPTLKPRSIITSPKPNRLVSALRSRTGSKICRQENRRRFKQRKH